VLRTAPEGLFYTPLTTSRGRRNGSRERLLDVAQRWPHLLEIRLHALATRVLLDADNRAVGIEYLRGRNLYRAHELAGDLPASRVTVLARKEVILAGGAFNTPQILMLSGIGPRADLEKLGIDVRVDLPGVGRNLQDRYEIGVVNRMRFGTWPSLRGARFRRGDPQYRAWSLLRRGMYTSNGAGLTIAKRSDPAKQLPDLFCMSLLGYFTGYYPGYSRMLAQRTDCLTWSVLKAHTLNRAGHLTLRSADPRDPPLINFHYFGEGSDLAEEDLRAVVAGIRLVRDITEPLRRDGTIDAEECPGPTVQTDAQLEQYVRDHAWGHHACGTCAIGSVLDADFQVHGVAGLRVVDASVFPRIPGYFIASAVYMIAEKAADAILAG
jgi:choline dehydrogenase-like flavoprotein